MNDTYRLNLIIKQTWQHFWRYAYSYRNISPQIIKYILFKKEEKKKTYM